MYTLLSGLYRHLTQKDEYFILILGLDNAGWLAGVSIIFKIRVFYKAWFEEFKFFIVWPYAVFHNLQVVFYESVHFMYL